MSHKVQAHVIDTSFLACSEVTIPKNNLPSWFTTHAYLIH